MTSSPGKRVGLAALPLVLLGLLLLMASRRPRPLMGLDGPAGIAGQAVGLTYSAQGNLVCASADGTLQRYVPQLKRFKSFAQIGSGAMSVGGQRRLALSPDGKTVAVALNRPVGVATVFDIATRKPVYSFNGPTGNAFDVSPDGKWAVCGVDDGLVFIDLSNPTPAPPQKEFAAIANFRTFKNVHKRLFYQASCASFSPDSRVLAVGFNNCIALFDMTGDLATPTFLSDMTGQSISFEPAVTGKASVSGIANPFWIEWAPDGTKLATFCSNEIAVFDSSLKKLATSASVVNAAGGLPSMGVNSPTGANLAWSKDGKTLFSGGDQVRRWSEDLHLEANYGLQGPVAISPDGKNLVTGNQVQTSTVAYPYLLQWRIG